MLALMKHVTLLCNIPLSDNALQQSTVGAPLPLFPLHWHSDRLGHPGSLRGAPAGTPTSSDVCAAESHRVSALEHRDGSCGHRNVFGCCFAGSTRQQSTVRSKWGISTWEDPESTYSPCIQKRRLVTAGAHVVRLPVSQTPPVPSVRVALSLFERKKGVEIWPSWFPVKEAFAIRPSLLASLLRADMSATFSSCVLLASQPILATPLLDGVCQPCEAAK